MHVIIGHILYKSNCVIERLFLPFEIDLAKKLGLFFKINEHLEKNIPLHFPLVKFGHSEKGTKLKN